MDDKLLHSLRQLISEQTGLNIREQDCNKLAELIAKRTKFLRLPSAEKYCSFLKTDNNKARLEKQELINQLTTGESYFFRDKGQVSLLRNLILPEIIGRRQKDRTLRIWSAGCSSGEEAYSIAILLDGMRNQELGQKTPHSALRIPHLKDWDILIFGTDINEQAVEKARKGIYSQWSFRMTDPDLRKRYFKKRSDEWELDEKIRKMVKFSIGNLMENSFPDTASDICNMDLILCRNVFIYFNSASVAVVLEKFTETLNDRGYLMTGHGELYGQSPGKLQVRMFPESVVYQKISAELGVESSELQKTEKRRTEVEKLRRYEVKGESVTSSQLRSFSTSKAEIPKLLTPNTQLNNYIVTAQKCADSGEYDKADDLCRKALDIDNTAVRAYFLLAQIAELNNNSNNASDLLKKVIYLNPVFVAAYLELGALYERGNDAERAKKMRTTAIELLRPLPPDSLVEPYEGVTAGELLEYLKKMV